VEAGLVRVRNELSGLRGEMRSDLIQVNLAIDERVAS
jgi:hypothetical protein